MLKAFRVTTLRGMKVSIAACFPVPFYFPVARSVGYAAEPSHAWQTGCFPVPTSAPPSASAGRAGGPVGPSPFALPSSDPAEGLHSVLAVGYDDATAMVEVENSWGPGFGDGGYGYVPYTMFGPTQDTLIAEESILAGDAWTLRAEADELQS